MNKQGNSHSAFTTCRYFLMCARVYFFLSAIMNEIGCYRRGICSFVSNYSFCSSLHRLSIDLREGGWSIHMGAGAFDSYTGEK